MIPATKSPLARLLVLAALCSAIFCQRALAQAEQVFGTESSSEAALIGTFYDLKQTPKRKPSGVTVAQYPGIVENFLLKGWDESILTPHFRSGRPIYATQVFIPMMDAGNAPKAFGLQQIVKGSRWVIHYKGQVSPPEDGTYRFVGYADDGIAVAVNGKTVLFSHRWKTTSPAWEAYAIVGRAANGNLSAGDWIALKKGDPVDLDVLIGEHPGGFFGAFLLIQKQGETYPLDASGKPILPIFQVAPHDTPDEPPNKAPTVSKSAKVWTCYQ